MSKRVPDRDELRIFLERMVTEARRTNDPARVDDLLDKLADLDGTCEFLALVIGSGLT